MERPETVGQLTEILRQGELSRRPRAGDGAVRRAEPAPPDPARGRGRGGQDRGRQGARRRCFGRKLIRLQCYEGIDTNQALYEWDYARQMLQIRALSEQQIADDDGGRQAVRPEVPAGAAAARGGPGR